MEYSEKQLLKLKEDIEKTKASLNQLKGEEKVLLKRLKEDWACSDLQEAKKVIKKYEAEIEESLETIKTLSVEISKYYESNE
jgi:hypothetical protein